MIAYKSTLHYLPTEGMCIARLYEEKGDLKINLILNKIKQEQNYISHIKYKCDNSIFLLVYLKAA